MIRNFKNSILFILNNLKRKSVKSDKAILKENKDYTNIIDTILGILLFIAVVALWYYSWNYIDTTIISKNKTVTSEEIRGQFGDKFGAINALFSALAFAGIIFSIFLQRRDLKYQREEIKETRKEFQIQNETLKIQRFENTFFNLLNQHHQIVNAMDFRYYKTKEKERKFVFSSASEKRSAPADEKEIVVINGRDVFRFRYNKLKNEIESKPLEFNTIYLNHYEDAQTDFGHYFRHLYRMIKSVDETDFYYNDIDTTEQDILLIKYKYVCIIRAQLSDFELSWLFYNCLSENGTEKFKPLIEKYTLFKNLPEKLIPVVEHIELYKPNAYKR